ncbi:unnamed protein product [Ophioblennius macclurei]
MLHINKLSVSHQNKAHPYMRTVYQSLDWMEDSEKTEGTLVQSFRSVDGPYEAPQGWIWFCLKDLNPSVQRAELVLFRKTLGLGPLTVAVTLHSVLALQGKVSEAPPLGERALALNQRPSSGFDVFDVSESVTAGRTELVGFQLRYTDESGSLVLHEALTQSLYSLDRGSVNEPLLVVYQNTSTPSASL